MGEFQQDNIGDNNKIRKKVKNGGSAWIKVYQAGESASQLRKDDVCSTIFQLVIPSTRNKQKERT